MGTNESSNSSGPNTKKLDRSFGQNARDNSISITVYVLSLIPFIIYLFYGMANGFGKFTSSGIYDVVFVVLYLVVMVSTIFGLLIQDTPVMRKLLPHNYDDFGKFFTDKLLLPFLVIVAISSLILFLYALSLSNAGVEQVLGQPTYMVIIIAIFAGIISIIPLMMYPVLKVIDKKNSETLVSES